MKNIKEFQNKMECGFDSIAVDIVGFCNAKCKYCPAGDDMSNIREKFISLDLFEGILKKLIEYKFYSPSTDFHIYCLGEPCLHPQINEVLKLLTKYGIRTTISTNASIVPKFDGEALKSVDRFLISMPGFSQDSYDRIHGFRFETIKDNIIKLKQQVDELSDGRILFDMSYHIYQFNEFEMVYAKAFCDQYGIRFAPNYAVMIDKDKCLDYVTGKMSYDELKDISKDIFLGVLDRQIKDAPGNYCDFQHGFLSINVAGDIRICSSFRRETETKILVGNILTDNIDDIIYKKYHNDRCEICIKAKLTLAKGYQCKVYPDGYYSIMKENEFVLSHMGEEKFQEKMNLMKLIRRYEHENYPETLRNDVLNCVEKNCLSEELEEIALKYTRFGIKTYNRLVTNANSQLCRGK